MSKEYIGREEAILAVRHAWAKGLEPTQYIEQIPVADVMERGYMTKDKFDSITRNKLVCCCDCGKWFPSARAFTKFYSSTAFMLCPKCANKLEQEIRRYKSQMPKEESK